MKKPYFDYIDLQAIKNGTHELAIAFMALVRLRKLVIKRMFKIFRL